MNKKKLSRNQLRRIRGGADMIPIPKDSNRWFDSFTIESDPVTGHKLITFTLNGVVVKVLPPQ